MAEFLRWPDDVSDPPNELFGAQCSPFLTDMVQSGAEVHADPSWMSFGFSRGIRTVNFTRRGKSRSRSPNAPNYTYWEVWLLESGEAHRLGPIFGIRDHACVVVCGFDHIQKITKRWLHEHSIKSVIKGLTFWDRMDAGKPLEPVR